jgi:hypothetical protein
MPIGNEYYIFSRKFDNYGSWQVKYMAMNCLHRDFSFLFPGTKRRGQGLKGTLEKLSNYGKLVHRLALGFFQRRAFL